MLKKIDSLPLTQRQVPRIYRNRQAGICQHGTDVGSGIIRAFKIMRIPPIPFGDETLHKSFQVGASGRVPVFTDDQRSTGMRQEQEAHAFAHVPFPQLRADGLSDVVQAFTAGGDFEGRFLSLSTQFAN